MLIALTVVDHRLRCSQFVQYHWSAADQRARENDTIRANLSDVQDIINTSVSTDD